MIIFEGFICPLKTYVTRMRTCCGVHAIPSFLVARSDVRLIHTTGHHSHAKNLKTTASPIEEVEIVTLA